MLFSPFYPDFFLSFPFSVTLWPMRITNVKLGEVLLLLLLLLLLSSPVDP
jgi:hypothetical protein